MRKTRREGRGNGILKITENFDMSLWAGRMWLRILIDGGGVSYEPETQTLCRKREIFGN
jgi:hypothetical protein